MCVISRQTAFTNCWHSEIFRRVRAYPSIAHIYVYVCVCVFICICVCIHLAVYLAIAEMVARHIVMYAGVFVRLYILVLLRECVLVGATGIGCNHPESNQMESIRTDTVESVFFLLLLHYSVSQIRGLPSKFVRLLLTTIATNGQTYTCVRVRCVCMVVR